MTAEIPSWMKRGGRGRGLGEIADPRRDPSGQDFADFAHLRIVLQVAARHIQRQIRRVEATLQREEKFRDELGAVIRDKDLVAEELDVTLRHVELVGQLREIEDPFQVEGEIDVEVNPEQRLI